MKHYTIRDHCISHKFFSDKKLIQSTLNFSGFLFTLIGADVSISTYNNKFFNCLV